jgi:hypothetical protein
MTRRRGADLGSGRPGLEVSMNAEHLDIAEAKLLLPWRASETLAPDEIQAVEAALVEEPGLWSDLAGAMKERDAVIADNEAAGFPSSRALEVLFAKIETQPRSKRESIAAKLLRAIWPQSSLALAWSVSAAMLICVLQAGALAYLLAGKAPADGYFLASAGGEADIIGVKFAPSADIAAVTSFLDRYHGSIVAGPRHGIYRVQVPGGEAHESAKRMAGEHGVVEFAAPVQ